MAEQLPKVDGNGPSTNEDILAALCAKADLEENKDIRDCLRAYKLHASEKVCKTALNKFSKDVLIKTLIFLNAAEKHWNTIVKSIILNELVCRIQNLLLDNCGLCGGKFATHLDEPSLLPCELCGQNIHKPCLINLLGEKYHENITSADVKSLVNPFQLKSFHYLCSSCSSTTIPSDNLKNTEVNKGDSMTLVDTTLLSNSNEVGGQGNGTPSLSNNATAKGHTLTSQGNDRSSEQWRERNDLCPLFEEGKCPYGISGKNCNYHHPHVCNRYRKNGTHPKYGCNLGIGCKDFHPYICPNSLKSHKCFNQNCTYKWHLPRTMRIAPSAGYGYRQNHQNNGHKYSHEMYPRQRRDFAYRNKSNFRRKSQRYNHHNYTFSPQSSAISYRFLDRMHNSNHSVSQGQGRG